MKLASECFAGFFEKLEIYKTNASGIKRFSIKEVVRSGANLLKVLFHVNTMQYSMHVKK